MKQPKKMLTLNILDILNRYTDAEHRISQKDIVKLLETEYEMTVDRKAVKRNLLNLIDAGYDIEYEETARANKNGEEEVIYSDWYINRKFSDSELRLLIDSLLFSKHIPYSQCKELVKKLRDMSSRYFCAKVKHICNLPDNYPANKQLFFTIDILDEAIEKGRQVAFLYNDFDIDKKLHPRTDAGGAPREYAVNPYQIVATNGRYYLIGNYDKYDDVSHYRLDRISEIRLTDRRAKPKNKVRGLENGLNLPKHMAEHIYMFAGDSVHVRFRADRGIVSDIVDWFGTDVRFSESDENGLTASVVVNENAMFYWCLQYGPFVEVLAPQTLRERVSAAAEGMHAKYGSGHTPPPDVPK
jgi:predicted DNA-binding transcriptional regulator YafY